MKTMMILWFFFGYFINFFAPQLNKIVIAGFPLGFYLFAQGSLLIYLVIIVIYVVVMNRMDRNYRMDLRR